MSNKKPRKWWIVVGKSLDSGEAIWHDLNYSLEEAQQFAKSPRRGEYKIEIIPVCEVLANNKFGRGATIKLTEGRRVLPSIEGARWTANEDGSFTLRFEK